MTASTLSTPAAAANAGNYTGYLRVLAFALAALLLLIGLLNFVVDPYLVQHTPEAATRLSRPNKNRLSALSKSLALARVRPAVVYVGNSRTEVGLPARHDGLGGRKAFNAALTGASLGDAVTMARHAMAVSDVSMIVLGVDFWTFTPQQTNPHLDRSLVARSPLDYAWRAPALRARHALSWDTTLASASVLRHPHAQECPSFLSGNGQRDPDCMVKSLRKLGGPRAAFEYWVRTVVHGSALDRAIDRANASTLLGTFIDEACRARVAVRLYVNPTHALLLDTVRLGGHWPEFEAWKRTLAAHSAHHPGCDLRIVDFSGYGAIATEPSPLVTDREMRSFWEASHFRSEVGESILSRLLQTGREAPDPAFGRELNVATVETELARTRTEQQRYVDGNAGEIAALERILDESGARNGAANATE